MSELDGITDATGRLCRQLTVREARDLRDACTGDDAHELLDAAVRACRSAAACTMVRARARARSIWRGTNRQYMESFCSAGRRESSIWALPVRAIELVGHRFRGSDLASPIWALRRRDMLRV